MITKKDEKKRIQKVKMQKNQCKNKNKSKKYK